MARSGIVAAFIFAVVLALSMQESLALKCWTCSSDTANGAFCSDKFDTNAIPIENRRWSYAECALPSQLDTSLGRTPVCQKIKDRVADRVVIRRRCTLAGPSDPKDLCMREQVSQSISREFCETCDSDGCNGAAQYGPAALFIAVSVAVAKFLAL